MYIADVTLSVVSVICVIQVLFHLAEKSVMTISRGSKGENNFCSKDTKSSISCKSTGKIRSGQRRGERL